MFDTLMTFMLNLTGVLLVILIATLQHIVTTINQTPFAVFEGFADLVMVFTLVSVLMATIAKKQHERFDDDDEPFVMTICVAPAPSLDFTMTTAPQVSHSDINDSISKLLTFEAADSSIESCSTVAVSDSSDDDYDDENEYDDDLSFYYDSDSDDDEVTVLSSPEPSSPSSPRVYITRYGRQIKRPNRVMLDRVENETESAMDESCFCSDWEQ